MAEHISYPGFLLASDDRSQAAFAPYAEERNERPRRLRLITEIKSTLTCDFPEHGHARRPQCRERLPLELAIASRLIANLAGPYAMLTDRYTAAYRTHVLEEA
jgi:hypothetical protein